MTKYYCDKCKEEITRDNSINISLSGHTSIDKTIYKNIHFCEKCYEQINKQINEFLPRKVIKESFA